VDDDYGGYTLREIRRLLIHDWAYGSAGGRLHHVATIDGPIQGGIVGVEGTTACGRVGQWFVPGILARMSNDRCKQCCRALKLPEGVGSPKNAECLRPWMYGALYAEEP
jgi:hypothetical protein